MSENRNGILAPATLLLQSMPIARKFFLILLVFTLPMAYLTWKSVSDKQQQIGFHQKQLEGLEKLGRVDSMLMRILQLRDNGYARKLGLQMNSAEFPALEQEVDHDLDELHGLGSDNTRQQLAVVRQHWNSIRQGRGDALDRHNRYAALSQSVRQYLHSLAEDSYVLLGDDRTSYQLSHLAVDSLGYGIDLVSAMQGLGSGIIARGNFTPNSFIKLSYYTGELDNNLKRLQRAYHSMDKYPGLDKKASRVLGKVQGFLDYTRNNVIDPDSFTIRARTYFDHAAVLLASIRELHHETMRQLHIRLDNIIRAQNWFKNEIIAISGLIILVMLYLFSGFYVSMKRGIHEINSTLAAIAKGDLHQKADVRGRDEIRTIGDNLNHMAKQLANLVQIAYSRSTENTVDNHPRPD
jgi:methyl-accepting chemotaxis protein